MISSFCHSINEIYALLGIYAAWIGRMLLMFWHNLSVPSSWIKQSKENAMNAFHIQNRLINTFIINTASLTLCHSDMFQTSKGHLQEV
jgi:hypothetical protein